MLPLCERGVKTDEDPLIARLVAMSKEKKSLYRWESFAELKLSAKQLAAAEKYIKEVKDYRSYHLLFAVKNTSDEAYKRLPADVKIMVLTSALRELESLNDWSRLHPDESSDGEAATALLQLGKGAISHLAPILKISDPAKIFGSEESIASSEYGYRRKDFAYRYISLILEKNPKFSADPKDRDKAIEVLIKHLSKP